MSYQSLCDIYALFVNSEMICINIVNVLRGRAVALDCCKAHSEMNRKMENLTPCKSLTPENFLLKLGTRDYIDKVTY